MVTERSNLAGGAETWMMIASVGTLLLPHVVDLLKTYITVNSSTKGMSLKIGDWSVQNPTPEMVDEFMRLSKDSG